MNSVYVRNARAKAALERVRRDNEINKNAEIWKELSLLGEEIDMLKKMIGYEQFDGCIKEGTEIKPPKDGMWVFLPDAMFPNKRARYCLEVKKLGG